MSNTDSEPVSPEAPKATAEGLQRPGGWRRRLVRLVVVLVLAELLAAGATAWVMRDSLDAQLRYGVSLLADGQAAAATQVFSRLGEVPVRRAESRRGLALAHLLAGGLDERDLTAAARSLSSTDGLPMELIFERMLRSSRSRALLDLLERAEPEQRRRFRRFEVLARLEQGELPVPASLDSPRLSKQLGEIVDRRRQGHRRVVFDRNGRLIGSWDGVGRFEPSTAASSLGFEGWLDRVVPPAAAKGAVGVRLALDLELTRQAREALGRERGSIVVMDLWNGEILAAASDARTLEREGPAFLDQLREPASIAKLMTTAAALRAGIDPDEDIRHHRCTGSIQVEDGHVWCPVVAGKLHGLDQALAWSCNSSFANLGLELGASAVVAEYQRFGFELGSAAAGDARLQTDDGTRRYLAELSIGLEHAAISPLHAARLAAVFGNGGSLIEPRWIRAGDGFLGMTPRFVTQPAASVRVVEKDDARRILEAMREVVRNGTARGVDAPGFPVAMKTGTASEPGKGFHVNYIGVAPWNAPRYAFAVRITNRRTSRDIRYAARVVTSRMLRRLARWSGSAVAVEPEPVRPFLADMVAAAGD